jgi:hypothetical protein
VTRGGLCATFFNLGSIYAEKNQVQEAMGAWTNSYIIAKQTGRVQIFLQALAKLTSHMVLPSGLEMWNELARQTQNDV